MEMKMTFLAKGVLRVLSCCQTWRGLPRQERLLSVKTDGRSESAFNGGVAPPGWSSLSWPVGLCGNDKFMDLRPTFLCVSGCVYEQTNHCADLGLMQCNVKVQGWHSSRGNWYFYKIADYNVIPVSIIRKKMIMKKWIMSEILSELRKLRF